MMRYMLKDTTEDKKLLINELDFITDYIELAKLTFAADDFILLKNDNKRHCNR